MKKIYVLIALFVGAFSWVLLSNYSRNDSPLDSGMLASVASAAQIMKVGKLDPKPVDYTEKFITKRPEATQRVLTTPPVEQPVETVRPVEEVQPVEQPAPKSDRPVWLNIPVSNVDARIIPVGVTETNNLDVPPNYVEVGWYKYGPTPGQIGSAVLDGHVDNGASIPGVLKNLRNLKKGDEIYVTAEDGSKKRFIVTESNVYQTKKFPSDRIFNDNSGALIKIITCHGTFVPSEDTYDQRLVVTARLAD